MRLTKRLESRSGFASLSIAAGLTLGCHAGHAGVLRLRRAERYDEVVSRVEHTRRPPRGRVALAYADALAQLGRTQAADSALLLAYRRGGDVRVLQTLAERELSRGLRGLAAHHFARIVTLDRRALRGRADVCELFELRGYAYLSADEGVAAQADVERLRTLCPDQVDAGLPRDASEAANRQRRAASMRMRAPAGPRTLDLPAQKTPRELVGALVGEARGEHGRTLLDLDTLRAWVGAQRWSDLAPRVMSQDGPVAAYVQLRLARVVPDLPVAEGPAGTRERDRWTEQSLRIEGAKAWRVYAGEQDVSTAELALSARWKPEAADANDAAPSVGLHWSARLPDTHADVRVSAARLRQAAGADDVALALLRDAASTSDTLARELAVHELGWGRPWQARVVLGDAQASELRAAIHTAVSVTELLCGGPCRGDDDRARARRVMGERWMAQQLARPIHPAPRTRGCPLVAELWGLEASGAVADGVRALRSGSAQALANAVSSELRMTCVGHLAAEAMAVFEARSAATGLLDLLVHAPEVQTAGELSVLSKFAMVAGQHRRAALFAQAAGSVADNPARTWRELGRFADHLSARELQLTAWREVLLHTDGVADPELEAKMVMVALRDSTRAWGQDRIGAAGATRAHVTSMLARSPREQRWVLIRELFRRVHENGFADSLTTEAREAMLAALLGDAASIDHPREVARLRAEANGQVAGPFDSDGLFDDVVAGRLQAPPRLTTTFANPVAFERVRVALAEHARSWTVRRAMAASVLAVGSLSARTRAWRVLQDMAAASGDMHRQRLRQWVLNRPVTLVGTPRRSGAASLVAGPMFPEYEMLRILLQDG